MRYFLVLAALLFTGCIGNNIAFRGTVDTDRLESFNEGKIHQGNTKGETTINAEKETNLDADIKNKKGE